MDIFPPTLKILPRNAWRAWTSLCLGITFALCMAATSKADLVSGHVYGAEGKFQPGDTFKVKNPKGSDIQVRTDQSRDFSVYLDPGRYKVEFRDRDGDFWDAELVSYPQPVRGDIHLKKRGK